jgi:hypothetical protein
MKILVACEFSGVVREAFAAKGHDAWSCDLLPTEISGKHIQGDVRKIINDPWDMILAFPECRYLSDAGNRWFKTVPPLPQNRLELRFKAIDFFLMFTETHCRKVCIENPKGIMNTIYKKPTQIICPTMFGHKEAKRTCLWLQGLPPLLPTEARQIPVVRKLKSGRPFNPWYSCTGNPKLRPIIRSRTFPGIAEAMANQWG